MTDLTEERRAWWRDRRKRYNLGLIVAGFLAFVCYVAVLSIFKLSHRLAEIEITVFTTLIQGLGYLVMMLIANLFYNLGSLSESLFKPSRPDKFRTFMFNLGFWFSVTLPFLVPGLLLYFLFIVPVLE